MNYLGPVLAFLFVLFGVPLLIYIVSVMLMGAATKPIRRAQQLKRIENDVRRDVDYANARQRVARKLLDEYDD